MTTMMKKKMMAIVGALIGMIGIFGMIAVSDMQHYGMGLDLWIMAPVAVIFTLIVICSVNEMDDDVDTFEEEDH